MKTAAREMSAIAAKLAKIIIGGLICFICVIADVPVLATPIQREDTGNPVSAPRFTEFQLLRDEARSGNCRAQSGLALYHLNHASNDVPGAAFMWMLRAARQGYPKAMVAVAIMYAEGSGVSQSASSAQYWYKRAAIHQEPTAFYNLATIIYSTKRASPATYAYAYAFYKISYNLGYQKAAQPLGALEETITAQQAKMASEIIDQWSESFKRPRKECAGN